METGFDPQDTEANRFVDILDGARALDLISTLPLPYRDILNLKFIHNKSIQEISALTHLSNNTVAVQTHRGIAKLKVLYEHTMLCNGLPTTEAVAQ